MAEFESRDCNLALDDHFPFPFTLENALSTVLEPEMADTSLYSPPNRPFLRPPSPSAIPSAEEVGLTGADAWAYGVSTRLMSDPGRWDLFNQVQAGMVWLDEYMKEIEDRLKSADDEEEVYVFSLPLKSGQIDGLPFGLLERS
jgi:hypothetical protein